MLVSVCMIVRNEIDTLEQAVASTVGLADEVAVYDTGSTDGTVELARSLGARVEVGGDRMHKGESRNYVAEKMVNGDWVVVLDADERIADPEGLRVFLKKTDAQAVFIRLAFMDASGNQTLTYRQMRCWRRGSYRYKYRAHELPIPVNGWGRLAYTDFVWEHRPPGGRPWKVQYGLDRLLLDVDENPGEPRPLYYLGRQYMYAQEYQRAVDTLLGYLDTSNKTDRADAWCNLATCYGRLENEPEQIGALHQACAEFPNRRDWWGRLATIYHGRGTNEEFEREDEEIAAGLLCCMFEISPSHKSYVVHHWFGAAPYDLMARVLWRLERYEEGREFVLKAVKLAPNDKRIKENLGWFDRQLSEGDSGL